MKFLKGVLKFIAILYVFGIAILYFMQDDIIFLPDKLEEYYQFRTGEEVEIEVDKDIYLNCLLMKERASKGVILYLHGNKGAIRRCISQAEMLSGNGYDILMPDYRGYGKSDGQMYSEKQALADVQKVYDYLKTKYSENQIHLAGYSLGTGMASYLAAHNNPKTLNLVAPYMSLPDVKNRRLWFTPDFLMKYHFPTEKYMDNIRCPITIFHGTSDRIIPYDSAERLKALKPDQINLVTLKEVSHRGAIFSKAYRKTMREVLR